MAGCVGPKLQVRADLAELKLILKTLTPTFYLCRCKRIIKQRGKPTAAGQNSKCCRVTTQPAGCGRRSGEVACNCLSLSNPLSTKDKICGSFTLTVDSVGCIILLSRRVWGRSSRSSQLKVWILILSALHPCLKMFENNSFRTFRVQTRSCQVQRTASPTWSFYFLLSCYTLTFRAKEISMLARI